MISFIGSGNMATAIVNGLLANKIHPPGQIACIGGPADDTAQKLSARTGIHAAATLDALLAPPGVDVVVAAIKPQQLADMPPALAELTRGKLVLSILAGKPLCALATVFPHARNLVRAMPNTPGAIGAGITGWCSSKPLSDTDRILVTNILNALGKHVELAESQLDAVTGLSGSGPAYVFEFAAALREAGIAAGLPRDTAQLLAIETILGSARLMTQTGTEPETLRNQVTSPNGTTYAGLQRMAARDFRDLIKETVLAAKTRSEELARGA